MAVIKSLKIEVTESNLISENTSTTTIRVLISKDTAGFPGGKTDFKINY